MGKKKTLLLGKSLMTQKKVVDKSDWQNNLQSAELSNKPSTAVLKSVTEQDPLVEFLENAELADHDFTAEHNTLKIVNSGPVVRPIFKPNSEHQELVSIPRRPSWDSETTPEELDKNEKESFLDWRRHLAKLEETAGVIITPYERNLEIWKQLWRVLERSDILIQVVDARNPLLFCCQDLESYVTSLGKSNLLLINKSDLLTSNQRKLWADYFSKINKNVVFFSALRELDVIEENEEIDLSEIDLNADIMLNRDNLISMLKELKDPKQSTLTVGMVGYPNVGKSSTINALLRDKKVSVSSTPGKTKHFQTHIIDEELCLCDCPGLVFPAYVSTKEEMIINGILPIDQLQDSLPPVQLLVDLVPLKIWENNYSFTIPKSYIDGVLQDLSAEELLNTYGSARGFLKKCGIPDSSRSARCILKDFVNGRIFFCFPPPDIDANEFNEFDNIETLNKKPKIATNIATELDMNFFSQKFSQAHFKGNSTGGQGSASASTSSGKPWKKHNNKNKHEKLRRIYANHNT